MTTRCPECGFDADHLSPSDAAVALRSFSRRFAALLEPPEEGPRPSDDAAAIEAAVLAHAAAAARAITDAGTAMSRILIEDTPAVPEPGTDTPVAGTGERDDDAIERLRAAAFAVAEQADQTSGRTWTRAGSRAGRTVTALDLLHEAVHAGAHHLRAAESAAGNGFLQ
jgi:hypothetical protein